MVAYLLVWLAIGAAVVCVHLRYFGSTEYEQAEDTHKLVLFVIMAVLFPVAILDWGRVAVRRIRWKKSFSNSNVPGVRGRASTLTPTQTTDARSPAVIATDTELSPRN